MQIVLDKYSHIRASYRIEILEQKWVLPENPRTDIQGAVTEIIFIRPAFSLISTRFLRVVS